MHEKWRIDRPSFSMLFIKIESLTQAFQSSQDELGFAQVYM